MTCLANRAPLSSEPVFRAARSRIGLGVVSACHGARHHQQTAGVASAGTLSASDTVTNNLFFGNIRVGRRVAQQITPVPARCRPTRFYACIDKPADHQCIARQGRRHAYGGTHQGLCRHYSPLANGNWRVRACGSRTGDEPEIEPDLLFA